ncbi:flippase [Spathaspora passalidarum NRRL Y-27907]|uniref:Man(5)GlcNAc(2)-PP-dolichol translocation protein RFT1 n=1 Tax=Spathaspora passalidarum (strain NRRL Y-27907 / 11-Y1) TaxID=619300 RepID=G3AHS7_SPAPN|nr:flippase [Spathaspora passalidarum NRRL Y-27907]EGW34241.1 flippase [Spathaspora passalidarum NRRL Y-27907]
MSKSTDEATSVISESTKGASSLILVQIITKLFTFLLNQLLIRYVSPNSFGLATYLEFLNSTILFFSREGERLAIQRIKPSKDTTRTFQSVINFGFLSLAVGVPIMLCIGYWQWHTTTFQESLLVLPFHNWTITLISGSILVELLIEPVYALYQFQLDFGKRSKFEGLAIFTRCVTTFVSVLFSSKYVDEFEGAAVASFAVGQFAYSFTLFVSYALAFASFNKVNNAHTKYSLYKLRDGDKSYYFDSEVFNIYKGFFIQMIFKQLLTEGDKLLINYLFNVDQQGVYAVITNYGSIIARLLFNPLEESTRLLFSRLLSSSSDTSKQSFTYLKLISVFYLNFCILVLFAGISNGSYLLQFILRGKWTSTNVFQLFQQYIAYIPFLAFNGILEAIFTSMANNQDMKKFSTFMTVITVVILLTSYLLIEQLEMGLSGLILANVINMSLRIAYCYQQIQTYYARHGIHFNLINIVKSTSRAIGSALVLVIVQYLLVFKGVGFTTKNFTQLVYSALLSVVLLVVLAWLERRTLKGPVLDLVSRFKRKSD